MFLELPEQREFALEDLTASWTNHSGRTRRKPKNRRVIFELARVGDEQTMLKLDK
jgi:hypothetical protein